eukprot:ANDGO_01976.mRNA.1 hypothetical protein
MPYFKLAFFDSKVPYVRDGFEGLAADSMQARQTLSWGVAVVNFQQRLLHSAHEFRGFQVRSPSSWKNALPRQADCVVA